MALSIVFERGGSKDPKEEAKMRRKSLDLIMTLVGAGVTVMLVVATRTGMSANRARTRTSIRPVS